MKNVILLFSIFFFSVFSHARILILNNNSGNNGHYRTIYEALAAAQDGDTIYCVGSSESYDSTQGVEINKAVSIIGPGYFLVENPNTNINFAPATIRNIKITSPNVSMIGISFDNIEVLSGNFFIKRCKGGWIGSWAIGSNIANIIVTQCYLSNINFRSDEYFINDVSIFNNYIGYLSEGGKNLMSYNNWVISGNTFDGPISSLFGESLINNICAYEVGEFSLLNCTVQYCIFVNDPVPATNNNLINVDFNTLFIGSTGNSTDGQWKLKPGSPAIGSGYNGVDRGMFGGATPYVLSGVPPIPAVYGLTVQPVSTNNALPVQVKIKSNN